MNPPRARHFAEAAFVAILLSLPFAWWVVTHGAEDMGIIHTKHAVNLFENAEPIAKWPQTAVTGALVVGAAILLFFRLAAGSLRFEPSAWRRDIWIAAALLGAALASAWTWPDVILQFWGTHEYGPIAGASGPINVETARPGVGWWLAALGLVLVVASEWESRRLRKI